MILGNLIKVLGFATVVIAARFGTIEPPLPHYIAANENSDKQGNARDLELTGEHGSSLFIYSKFDCSNAWIEVSGSCTACVVLDDGRHVYPDDDNKIKEIDLGSAEKMLVMFGDSKTDQASLKKILKAQLKSNKPHKYKIYTIPMLKVKDTSKGKRKRQFPASPTPPKEAKKSNSVNNSNNTVNANDEALAHFGRITPIIQQAKVTGDVLMNGDVINLNVVGRNGRLFISKVVSNGKANLSCWDSCIAYIVLDDGSCIYPGGSGIIADFDINRAKNVHFMFGNANADLESLRKTLIARLQSRSDIGYTIYTIPLQRKGEPVKKEPKEKKMTKEDVIKRVDKVKTVKRMIKGDAKKEEASTSISKVSNASKQSSKRQGSKNNSKTKRKHTRS